MQAQIRRWGVLSAAVGLLVGCAGGETAAPIEQLSDVGGDCTVDSQCGTGLICVDGTCGQSMGSGCDYDYECTSGYCVDGACSPRGGADVTEDCTVDDDCVDGLTCPAGSCVLANGEACTDPAQCASGVCAGDLCVDGVPTGGACDTDNPCATGNTCVVGICLLDDGGSCSLPTECVSGYCVGLVCSPRGDAAVTDSCTVDIDCAAGLTCPSGTCQLPTGEACNGPTECVTGNCVDSICCDSACDGQCEASTCSGGTCDISSDGTSCDDSVACTDNDACGAGICSGDTNASCVGLALVTDDATAFGLEGLYDATYTSWGQAYCISWGDYDNDGDQDVFLGGPGPTETVTGFGNRVWVGQFYENDGDGTFSYYGPTIQGARAGYWGDPDNDGDLDLVTTAAVTVDSVVRNRSRLYVNQGDGSFVEEEAGVGLDGANNMGTSAWLDVDADGWIDLFYPSGSVAPMNAIRRNLGQSPLMFEELNDSTTPSTGELDANHANGESNVVGDIDNDGDIDIWWHDEGDGSLYINDATGVFTEQSSGAGLAIAMYEGVDPILDSVQPYYAPVFGDYNNDGWLDVFFGHPETKANRLYTNTGTSPGDLSFTLETTAPFLAEDIGHTRGASWGDFDNDGDLDLLLGNEVTNTTVGTYLGASNSLYENRGAAGFVDIAPALGIDVPTDRTHSVSLADFDSDGDLDVVFANQSRPTTVFRNELNDDKFLQVKLVGKGGAAGGASVDGIGTRVELWDEAGTTLLAMREVSGGEGYGSHPVLIQHFGLAAAWGGGNGTYTVRARFLSGTQVERTGVVPANTTTTVGTATLAQTLEIIEP